MMPQSEMVQIKVGICERKGNDMELNADLKQQRVYSRGWEFMIEVN